MKVKRTYAAVDVEHFDLAAVLDLLTVDCIVSIDVAKTKFVAAIATAAGDVLKLVKFEHPRQTAAFLDLLGSLQQAERKPVVVMEPTGTYGDALRYQCHALGLPVHMMPPKHTHDFAEVFDGVPSMHDPKAATVLAKLQAIKPSGPWQPESEARRDLRAWVDQRRPIGRMLAIYHGHLKPCWHGTGLSSRLTWTCPVSGRGSRSSRSSPARRRWFGRPTPLPRRYEKRNRSRPS